MRAIERVFLNAVGYFSECCEQSGIFSLIQRYNQKKVTILMYHGITGVHDTVANFDGKHVEKSLFEKQLTFLKKKYTIISLTDYINQKMILPKNAVILTFDDGYANLYTQLFPIIKKEKIPITIFLPTAYIGKKQIGWYDKITHAISVNRQKSIIVGGKKYLLETNKQKRRAIVQLKLEAAKSPKKRQEIINEVYQATKSKKTPIREDFCYLSWKQCKEMQAASIVFGSHTVSHPLLSQEEEKQVDQELQQSKNTIEKKLGQKCIAFAYPFGDYNENVIKKTKTQYTFAVTTKYGLNTRQINSYALRRIAINNLYSEKIFPLILLFNFVKMHQSILMRYNLTKMYIKRFF